MSNHICYSPFADNKEMKELHPCIVFHMHDWLTHHFLVKHCQAMSHSFARLSNDPDIEVLKIHNIKKEQKRENKGQKVLKKR